MTYFTKQYYQTLPSSFPCSPNRLRGPVSEHPRAHSPSVRVGLRGAGTLSPHNAFWHTHIHNMLVFTSDILWSSNGCLNFTSLLTTNRGHHVLRCWKSMISNGVPAPVREIQETSGLQNTKKPLDAGFCAFLNSCSYGNSLLSEQGPF